MIREKLVNLSQRIGLYQQAVKIDTALRNARLKRNFRRHGLEALVQADRALRSVGSFVFLDFGTLLGAYRDKTFIPYDFDLDVGILCEKRPDNLPEIMQSFGFKHLKQNYVGGTGRIVEDVFSYKGVQIDFFVYFEQGDELYCYIGRRHESKPAAEANATDGFPTRLSWVTDKGFHETTFLGHRFFVPTNTAQWLEDIYGASYMTPIKNWSEFGQKTRIAFHNERTYRRYYNI